MSPTLGSEPDPGDQEGTEACPPDAGSRRVRAQPARRGCGRRRAELGRERVSESPEMRRLGEHQRLGTVQGCLGFLFKVPTHHPKPGTRPAVQRGGCVPGCARSSEPGAAAGARGDLPGPAAASVSPSAQWGRGQHPPPGDAARARRVAASSRPQEIHRLGSLISIPTVFLQEASTGWGPAGCDDGGRAAGHRPWPCPGLHRPSPRVSKFWGLESTGSKRPSWGMLRSTRDRRRDASAGRGPKAWLQVGFALAVLASPPCASEIAVQGNQGVHSLGSPRAQSQEECQSRTEGRSSPGRRPSCHQGQVSAQDSCSLPGSRPCGHTGRRAKAGTACLLGDRLGSCQSSCLDKRQAGGRP